MVTPSSHFSSLSPRPWRHSLLCRAPHCLLSLLCRGDCSAWRWALLNHVVNSQVAPTPDIESHYNEESCGLRLLLSARTVSIRDTGYYLPSLFFRVLVVDYSLNNGVKFQDQTLKITSRKCVSVRLLLWKAPAMEGQILFRGKRGEQWPQAVPARSLIRQERISQITQGLSTSTGGGGKGADTQLKLGNYPGCSQMSRPCRTSAFSVSKCHWCTWREKLELQANSRNCSEAFPTLSPTLPPSLAQV